MYTQNVVEINDIICRKCVAFYILPQTHDYNNKKKSSILIHNIKNGNTFTTLIKNNTQKKELQNYLFKQLSKYTISDHKTYPAKHNDFLM